MQEIEENKELIPKKVNIQKNKTSNLVNFN